MAIALRCAAAALGIAKCVPVTTTVDADATNVSSMSPIVERGIGAIAAVENHRRCLVVAHAEDDERGQSFRDRRRTPRVSTPSR